MGRFIERLRRQRARELEEAARVEQTRISKAATLTEREQQKAERTAELKRAAEEYLRSSDFPALIDEILEVNPHAHKSSLSELDLEGDPISIQETSADLCLVKESGRDYLLEGHSNYYSKYLVIEAKPDGTIVVYGLPLIGTSKLPLDKWTNNHDIQERALEKAYRHPLNYKGYRDWDPGPEY